MGEQRTPHIRKTALLSEEVLYDGIKPWMANSVRNWLNNRLYGLVGSHYYYDNELIHNVELHARINLGKRQDGLQLYQALIDLFDSDENFALDIVQGVVELSAVVPNIRVLSQSMTKANIETLNKVLLSGGSKWHVVINDNKATVEARVNETTSSAYKKLVSGQEDYARLLKTSWEYCYGRGPSPSEAYTYAIKSVESASWHIITPSNTSATLGSLIKDFVAQSKAGKFDTIFNDKKENLSIDAITSVMSRLWQGHSDRHATGPYVEPSQEEAEAAVHMAIFLCHLFSTNAVIKKQT